MSKATRIKAGSTSVAEMVDTRIGRLEFELGVPTPETVGKIYEEPNVVQS